MIQREQNIKTLAGELANGEQMNWLMETGTLTHTLDTVLFPLILANMFHCYIPKTPNNNNIATMYIL